MKTFTTLFLLAVSVSTFGQTSVYHPFPDSNAIWNIDCGVWPDCNGNWPHEYFSYTISGDTVINSITYHKWVIPYVMHTDTCDTIYRAGYIAAFRNDILNKKVYYIPSGGSTEDLLYDFNITVGDTIKRCGVTQPFTMKVTAEDSVLVGGNYRKKWHASSLWGGQVDIIEGIGGTNGPIDYCPVIDPPTNFLTCFSHNGTENYPNVSCGIISYVKSNELELMVTLFPNPFHSTTTLHLKKDFGNAELKIYNSLGRQVRRQEFISQTTTINRDGLENGLYFYQVTNGSSILTTGKLIID